MYILKQDIGEGGLSMWLKFESLIVIYLYEKLRMGTEI